MFTLLDLWLSEFKWYRKKRGGTWYYVSHHDSQGGMQGLVTCWQRTYSDDTTVIKTETYPIKNHS